MLAAACERTSGHMTRYGFFLPAKNTSRELVRLARMAEEAGFDSLWISDHFHPWLEEQDRARLPGRCSGCTAGLIRLFRDSGGGDRPVQGGLKVREVLPRLREDS
jgi:alkanesulfonate monooxygenase SsuD/methylene tetrahydromethanopterin reductase-like flavin-dependent oxidoreductase (luciferase family)